LAPVERPILSGQRNLTTNQQLGLHPPPLPNFPGQGRPPAPCSTREYPRWSEAFYL
jgi:hypothetical protein